MTVSPYMGGVRKSSNTQPRMEKTGIDSAKVSGNCLGTIITSSTAGNYADVGQRLYSPGNAGNLDGSSVQRVAAWYSCGKFLPGCKIRWEPNVGANSNGRIYCAFVDNPEVMLDIINETNQTTKQTKIRGLSGLKSFPVWQETEIPFPTRTRHKLFSSNQALADNYSDYDRSVQTCFFYFASGVENESQLGGFWYHDVMSVEGLHNNAT